MTRRASLQCLAGPLVAFAMTLGVSLSAEAVVHSLTGNARFQIGNGLPIPIGFTAPPNGKVAARAGATIRQHGGNGKLVLDPSTPGGLPGQLFFDGVPQNLPVAFANLRVFQVQTNVLLQFPREQVSFDASGRTGADTLTWCPGSTVTANGNPMCATPDAGVINGRITYTRTAGQFGGPASGFVGGSANVALRPQGVPDPCTYGGGADPNCFVVFALATPATEGAVGNAFGFVNTTAGAAPNPGAFFATIAGNGEILNIVNPGTGLGPGAANPVTEFGAPWTAGSVRISVTDAFPGEIFTLMGNDARTAGGQGAISFVAGSVSARTFTGPNANRGWLNLTIGPAISHAPVMPLPAVGALIGLLALSGAYVLRRRSQAAAGRAQ